MDITDERKREIKQAVLNFFSDFVEEEDYRLPFPIEKVITNIPGIHITTYSHLMEISNSSYEDVMMTMDSKDSSYNHSGTLTGGFIAYNDLDHQILFSYRYRWNLAHELGHICLKHCKDDKTRICRNSLSKAEYRRYEDEADYFAQLVLVPHACLGNFPITKPKHIAVLCKVSNQASLIRFREFTEWKNNLSENDEYDQRIFKLFYNFSFKRKCKNCKRVVIQRYGKYCIFCGEKKLQWSSENDMKYNYPLTYESGKLVRCPVCQNEETNIEGDFCQICGTNLHNYCTNGACNQGYLPSNARFCPVCGTASYFYQNNILQAWNYNGFMEIPDDIDDELPFN